MVLISTLIISIIYLLVFFYLYILVMGVYRAYLTDRLNKFVLVLCLPAVALGIVFDIVANLTIATIVFRRFPREWLVTTRLTKIQNNQYEHKHNKAIAKFVCDNMLDIFDPSGNHC